MMYFMVINNQQTGPVAEEQLLEAGLTPDTLVWCEGMPQWLPASQVPQLAHLFAQQQGVPPQPPCYGTAPGMQQPYRPEKPNCRVGWAVVLTILGFVCCGIIPGVFGVLAIVEGNGSESLWAAGRYDEAEAKARLARRWVTVTAVIEAVTFVLCVAFMLLILFGMIFSSVAR